ncbi:methyltransferase [Mongoliimonas terrestris]|uniref:methyltransferase n=1 Tax=Mongoliimonas terrestris TaxID=1709001 RepID=UPI0009499462|nr:methyltransferase [Mongoliimonas terrestris]
MPPPVPLADRSGGLGGRLLDGWREWRNRLVASPRFQRFAADTPLVRAVAAHHASSLFDVCAGFVYSQVLLAAVRLDLFDILAEGPLPLPDLAARLRLPLDGARRLAEASVALGLLEQRSGGRYGLGLQGAALRGNPGLLAMIDHHALVYADLADPVALLQGRRGPTGLGRFWPYATAEGGDAVAAENGGEGAPEPPAAVEARQGEPGSSEAYSRLMSATQGFVRDDILDAYDFGRHRTVMDVGGGDGTFLTSVAARHPDLNLRLFDLPPVAALAARRFEVLPAPQPTAIAGDFRRDPLPAGADLITFVRILHDHDDATVRLVLQKAHAALAVGGRVLIAEPMADSGGNPRVGGAYFNFYLLAMGHGRPRTPQALTTLLRDANLSNPRRLKTRRPMLVSALVAERVS